MRFDFAAFRRAWPARLSPSPSAVFAAAGTSFATLMIGYVVLFGGAKSASDVEIRAKTVAVKGPVFTPVVATPAAARDASPSAAPVHSVVPPLADDARDLTRAVQTALKDAGCYHGAVDGVWAGQTTAAMEEFTRRVNARLPVEEPDAVLLALVETHDDVSCAVENAGEEAGPPPEQAVLETGSIRRDSPTMKREAIMTRDVVLSSSATFETHGRAEHLSYADETRPASKTEVPHREARASTASVAAHEPAEVSPAVVAPPPVARVPKAVRRDRIRRSSRRAHRKPPSLSRSLSRSFRSIQRNMNRLF
ncbi:MAG TPA: hypothetical protein PK857_07090 [Hyphomicrobium sp.]|nr:hypothetical protein [Hyphomicrobium sp.]HRO50675.1 hypothetical protein [Hyphomicrobium sp.]